MERVFATYREGRVILDTPVDWPNGTRIAVSPVDTEAGAEMSSPTHGQLSADDLEKLVDELCDIVDAAGPNRPPLSDYAVSRQGIYEDHL